MRPESFPEAKVKSAKELEQLALELDMQKIKIEVRENGEKLLDLKDISGLSFAETNREYFVREQVFEKIRIIAGKLEEKNIGLMVNDAYRSLARQKHYWDEGLGIIRGKYPEIIDEKEIIAIAKRFIAPVEEAQHCTGGSVDVALFDLTSREILPFGGSEDNVDEKSYTDYPGLDLEAKKNRAVLRAAMEAEGFANYMLEWWHYSFGNQEWAAYKQQPFAIYGPLELKENDFEKNDTI